MSKIVNFNDLKNKKNDDKHNDEVYTEPSNNSDDKDFIKKLAQLHTLIENKDLDGAIAFAEGLIDVSGYNVKICEPYISAIVLNSDNFDEENFKKYYFIIKKIYNAFTTNEYIAHYILNFYVYNFEKVKEVENESFIYNDFFEKVYLEFSLNENIAYAYATALLLNLDDIDESNQQNNLKIFDYTIDKFLKLIITHDDDEVLACEFAKFLHFASIKSSNKQIIEKSEEILKELCEDFDDDEEILTFYCLFISIHHIVDCEFNSVKYITEYKQIIDINNSFILKEILFIALYNLTFNVSYENCKFALKQMRSIIYNLEKEQLEEHGDLIELYAETFSNYSCDPNLSVNIINDEILTEIVNLINKFGKIENLILEYCVVLYNISCLLNYYEGEDAPHIDVLKELENCAEHFDFAIPYYCLCLSNLIHLNNREFGLDIVDKIYEFYESFSEEEMPKTKNNYTLKVIYAISLLQLIEFVELDECEELLLKIKSLIESTESDSLDMILSDNLTDEQLKILKFYTRGLTSYSKKLKETKRIKVYGLISKFESYLK